MLHIQRSLAVVIVIALLISTGANALPIKATPLTDTTPTTTADRSTPPDQPAAPTASGPSMYLNGSNYVNVPHASLPAIGSSDLTLEAWIYPTNVTGFHAVMAKQYNIGFWFGVYNGRLRFYRGSTSFVEGATVIPVNRWTHIAVYSYYDAFDNAYFAEFFINGDSDGFFLFNGAAAVGGTSDLHIGNDLNTEYFVGDIAEARLWAGLRGSESIRRDMHVAINEKRPGLVADWHLTGDFKDAINGIDGTPVGSPAFVGFPSPAQPLVAQTDRFFNYLPQNTYAAAAAFVPRLNRAIVAGGYRNGVPSTVITSIDAASGVSSNLGNLPAPRGYATAAYATSNDTVYVFGGSDQLATTNAFDSIYAINPETGAVRTVAATLPAGRNNATAVYLDHLNQIVVLGGWYYDATVEQYADSVYVFDVASETIATAPFTLLQPGYGLAAAYSPVTQKVYYFGGSPNGTVFDDKAYAITLNADHSGSVETLAVQLPQADRGGVAVEDPITHLIYVINGQTTARVIAFDPMTNELWPTPIELPRDDGGNLLMRPYSSVIYSPRQRHALVIGGGYYTTSGANNVWRIPLGDGPNVPIGHWGSINSNLGNIDYMSSVYWRVALGRKNSAVQYFDSDYFMRYPGNLAATGLGGMTTRQDDGTTWFSTWNGNTVSIKRDTGSAIETRFTETRVLPIAADAPDAVVPYEDFAPFFGSGLNLKWQNFSDYVLGTWHTSFIAPGTGNWDWTHIPAIAHRNFGEAWAIVEPWYTSLGRPESPDAPNAGPVATRPQLGRVYYEYYGTNYAENLYGFPCGTNLWANDLVFGLNGDWWIGGRGGVCRYANAYPPNQGFSGNLFVPTIGTNVVKLSVDGDGRIWAALMPDSAGNSGGLSAYEVLSTTNSSLGTVRTQDWNWLTAPIGSLTSLANGWNSGLRALTANGERVWMALNTDPNSGPLVMFSPRWQQLTSANQGSLWGVRKVFLTRGRAFLATNGDRLVTLQPDGVTWDDRALASVKAVLGDSRGRIWIGASDGVRRWLPSGWDMIDGAIGTPPLGPINAIAEDSKGRMWIGGDNGLTLFDRERWVTTLQPPTGSISVTAVLVDRDDNVWAGTTQGLARLNADQSWTTFTTADNLYTNNIFDIAQLGDGQIAVSTSGTGGGLSLFNGTTFVKQTYPPGKDQPLTADQTGRLWAGAIQREPTGYYGRFWTNSGLIRSEVVDNASDGANLVWFTHPAGGISIRSAFLPALADVQPQISPVNGVVPNRGSQGDTIVINGSGFGNERTAVEVIIGGAPTDISSVTDNQITLRLRGDNLTGDVTVRRGKRAVTVGGATPAFCAVPRITNVTPTGGNVGVEIKITGSNFDVGATVQLGGGSVKTLGLKGAGTASAWIDYNDTNGNLVINNKCANTTATFNDFRKINVSISQIVLNQGMAAYGLMAERPTLVSTFFVRDQNLRPADVIKADGVEVFVNPIGGPLDGDPDTLYVYTRTIPTALGSTPMAQLNDLVNSLNVPNVYASTGSSKIGVRLLANGKVVAQSSVTRNFDPNYPLNVLLIPIMPDGYTPQDLNTLKNNVASGWGDLRARLLPNGRGVFDWSAEVLTSGPIDLGSEFSLFDISHQFDRIRERRNRGGGTQYTMAFGVVAESLKKGGTTVFGYGFWPDVSEFFNKVLLSGLDTLCDIGNTALQIVSFGFLGSDDGCHLTIPLYVGWATATKFNRTDSSALFGHELGHILNLVKPWAANGSLWENLSHSINDELDGGNCNDSGATYNQDRTLYTQPGVSEPVVNPITGEQFYSQLTRTITNTMADKNTNRGKSIMAYACNQTNRNVFFEPADVAAVKADLFGAIRPLIGVLPLRVSQVAHTTSGPTPRVVPGERLHISGLITQTASAVTGEIRRMEALGEDAPLSVPMNTGYWLVQRTASGTEVQRDGVFPLFATSDQDSGEQRPADGQMGFYAATILRAANATRIDLEHEGTLLASFTTGSSASLISITSPTGGTYSSGEVPIAWSASDGDGDPLEISIEYSRDDGATWTPIGSAQAGGTLNMPVERLGGSSTARIRVTASDGFTFTVATSAQFSVAAQPPQPHITQPEAGSTALEGQTTLFSGGAGDLQDETITTTQSLRWFSNLDGALGTGADLPAVLSVGTHTITLEAENSVGLTATTEITLTVTGDYDGDTIADTVEAADGLNPLTSNDAFSDADGDTLPLVMELHYGTNPDSDDSDGDGRTDDQEIIDQTDPTTNDTPPLPDALHVSPAALTMTVDLAQDTVLPQDFVQIFSRDTRPFTVTADVDWLSFSAITGTTPAQLTMVINPIGLAEGTQTGTITVNSDLGSITVPITVTATNKADFCDTNRDGVTNQADVTAVQARVGTVLGDANYAVQYDVDRDGDIDAQDAGLISACAVTYGDVRALYLPLIRK